MDGQGPTVLLIHGTATDQTTWSIQRAGLREHLRLIAFDRRGAGRSPLPKGEDCWTVGEHALDAAALLEELSPGAPAVVCGSSFGGVVALELMRQRPELVRAAVLIEPPLPPTDLPEPQWSGFIHRFDEVLAREGGPAAAELFLRTVLGDAGFERIPRPFQERAKSMWEAIRCDCVALDRYRVGYATLEAVRTPVTLIGGDRSAELYRPTLHALEQALGNARLEILANAGHMAHADAFRRFNALLLDAAR